MSESAEPYPDDDAASATAEGTTAPSAAEAEAPAVDEAGVDEASAVEDASDPVDNDPSVAAVHAAVGELDDLDRAPLTEHADRYERVHGALQDVLADTDPGLGRA